jgi:ribonuclease I
LPAKVPVAFGGAAVERALVQSAVSATPNTKVDAACLVNAARGRGAAFTSPGDDAPVLALDWQPAYVAANLDLAASCVPAGG